MVRAAAGSRQRWAGLVPGLQAIKEKERVLLRPAMVRVRDRPVQSMSSNYTAEMAARDVPDAM